MQYLLDWTNTTAHGKSSSELISRPRVPAMLYDNTTVKGSWINVQPMAQASQRHGRIINNVSLAFPHPGVATAAWDPRNRILQPAELSVRILKAFIVKFADYFARAKASMISTPPWLRRQSRFFVSV